MVFGKYLLPLAASALFFSSNVFAAGVVISGTVTSISTASTLVFVALSVTPAPGAPACATNTYWDFVFPTNLQSTTAILLTAQMSGRRVDVYGTGTCTNFGSIEDLSSAQLH